MLGESFCINSVYATTIPYYKTYVHNIIIYYYDFHRCYNNIMIVYLKFNRKYLIQSVYKISTFVGLHVRGSVRVCFISHELHIYYRGIHIMYVRNYIFKR